MFGDHKTHQTQNLLGGTQHLFQFDNGYGASVVCHRYSYGSGRGLWELAVLGPDGRLVYDTPVTDDVLGRLTETEVTEALDQVKALPSRAAVSA